MGEIGKIGFVAALGEMGSMRTGCIADIVLDQYLKSRKMSGAF